MSSADDWHRSGENTVTSTTLGVPQPRLEVNPAQPHVPVGDTAAARPILTPVSEQKFRPDIEGLRALAVLAVVLYHAGVSRLPGGFAGVDVFFVISGFLITSQLLGEIRATGTVKLRNFWARRARRLLPAVATVLAATSVAVIVLWPALRRATALIDIAVAAVYGANWRFIATNVEYAATSGRSPVLHLWSLGVEEQFYLVWPLLVLGCIGVARWLNRRGWTLTRILAVSLGLGWIASFAYCLVMVTKEPMFAYFSLPTRAWQLATGALLAVAATRVGRLQRPAKLVLGWAGLIGIVVAVLTLTEGQDSAYPSVAALLPTLAAAAVIASGIGWLTPRGPVMVLRVEALQVIGRLSYGWYLWHWPVVVMAPAALERKVSVLENLALSLAALGVAWVSYHLIENPIRHSRKLAVRPRVSLALGAAFTLIPALLAYGLISKAAPGAVTHTVREASQRGAVPLGSSAGVSGFAPSPQASTTTSTAREQRLSLTPLQATNDRGLITDRCQVGRTAVAPAAGCARGAKGSADRMVLLGDSHASQWYAALHPVAVQQGVELTAWTKSWCQLTDVPLVLNGKPYTACQQWREEVLRRLRANPPRTIVVSGLNVLAHPGQIPNLQVADPTTGQVLRGQQARQAWIAGYQRMLGQLRALTPRVVVIADTPTMTHMAPQCLAATGSVAQCSTPRAQALSTGEDAQLARAAGVSVWDFTDDICGPQVCSAVNGEHIAWFDLQHLTASFVATLAPRVGELYRNLPR